MKRFLAINVLLVGLAISAAAEIKLPDVISSGMVLQRNQNVPIWGTADPGEKVTVTFGGRYKSAVTDASGKWHVDLGKYSANATPQTMSIAGKNAIVLNNILVGEVWLVSGQSNMQWRLKESTNGEAAVAAATHPNLRLFNVRREVGFNRTGKPIATWLACTPESVLEFSAAGYYFAVELQKKLNVPIGVINSSWGGSQAEAWTPVEYLQADPELKATVERTKVWEAERAQVRINYDAAIKKWREDQEKAKAAGARPSPSPGVPDALREYRIAASIYTGMIEPLIPFAIKGAVWYQGESNEARAEQYNILLPTMIRSWRERWGKGEFPFGVIQLPNYRGTSAEPTESAWSFLREAQRQTALKTKNTGLIVTIDIGEANDIHPKNKLDVGKRMFVWAMNSGYGVKMSDSPILKKSEVKGDKIVLTFTDVGIGLKTKDNGPPADFAIAGSDKKWIWAEAKIVGKDKIEVWSSKLTSPLAVRYAFNSNPKRANVTNDSGIPASPFRTDTWPDPTAGKR